MCRAAAALFALLLVSGCASDDGAATASRRLPAGESLRILLVNDDGIGSPAIDVMLGLLVAEPDLQITVVAPAEDRSGTSDRLTEGRATYRAAATPAGVKGYAVDGFPGDAVVVALEDLGLKPHLVVSGVNLGQNVGPYAAISGTVGAGRTAIRRGVPALAVSAAAVLDREQFTFAGRLALDWIRKHGDALMGGTHQTATVTSINVPSCPVSRMGSLREVDRATAIPAGVNPFESSCDLRGPAPVTDVAAIAVGYPTSTQIPPDV